MCFCVENRGDLFVIVWEKDETKPRKPIATCDKLQNAIVICRLLNCNEEMNDREKRFKNGCSVYDKY